ncbi:hypothetical protein BC829DRAFT_93682 [Chytridium lagenaria]|nr:hypothetical protein BC829DRAFT_93682 [Chytridium lagenaria]
MANESDSLISTTKSVVEGCIDALKQIHAKRPVVDDLFISVKNPASFTDKKLGLGPEIEGMRLQLIRKIKKLDERVTDVTSLFDSCRANIADAQANRFARRGEWENICKNVRHLTKQALLLSENLDAIAKDVEGLKLTSSPSPVHQTTEVSRSVFQVPKIDNDDGSLRPKGSVELADATLKSMVLRTGFCENVQVGTNSDEQNICRRPEYNCDTWQHTFFIQDWKVGTCGQSTKRRYFEWIFTSDFDY